MIGLLLFTLMLGWLRRRQAKKSRFLRRFHQFLLVLTVLWIANLAFPIASYYAVKQLEDRFTAPQITSLDPAVIVILGGWQGSGYTYLNREMPPISAAGDRLITGLILAEQFPRAKIYLPGGLKLSPHLPSEAEISRNVLDGLNLDPKRFIVESTSKNTSQNAEFIRAMIDHKPDQEIVLVTSAWHMPRSMGAFRQTGLTPIAMPTDYLTAASDVPFRYLIGKGYVMTAVALHEYVGMLGYWMTGRTQSLFPSP